MCADSGFVRRAPSHFMDNPLAFGFFPGAAAFVWLFSVPRFCLAIQHNTPAAKSNDTMTLPGNSTQHPSGLKPPKDTLLPFEPPKTHLSSEK